MMQGELEDNRRIISFDVCDAHEGAINSCGVVSEA